MAIDYESMADTAKRLIEENGTRCVLKNPGSGSPVYNPATNEYETNEEKFEGICIISGYEDRLVDGTVIQAGDRKVTAVLAGEPKPGLAMLEVYDKAGIVLKETYRIINSTLVNPNAETVIMYRLHCRK